MRSKLLTLGLATLLVTAAFGASAFTTGQVTRSQQIAVKADQNALIGFQSGSDLATINDGTLSINPSFANANGVNDKGTFRFGSLDTSDGSASTSKATFTIVNQDDVAHTYKVGFTSEADSNSKVNVKFKVYYLDSGAVKKVQETITDESGVKTLHNQNSNKLSLAANEKLYVVVKIYTNEGAYDDGDNISGTFEVTAT